MDEKRKIAERPLPRLVARPSHSPPCKDRRAHASFPTQCTRRKGSFFLLSSFFFFFFSLFFESPLPLFRSPSIAAPKPACHLVVVYPRNSRRSTHSLTGYSSSHSAAPLIGRLRASRSRLFDCFRARPSHDRGAGLIQLIQVTDSSGRLEGKHFSTTAMRGLLHPFRCSSRHISSKSAIGELSSSFLRARARSLGLLV